MVSERTLSLARDKTGEYGNSRDVAATTSVLFFQRDWKRAVAQDCVAGT